MGQYLLNTSAIEAAYLKAKVLPTPADADYVRFSWMVVTAVFLGFKSFLTEAEKKIQFVLLILLSCLIVYLHMLASKTGLLCLYCGVCIYILHLFLIEKKWKSGLMLIMLFFATAITAYNTLPTLRNRVHYVLYDFSLYSKGTPAPGYNDAARWLSIRAGYTITKEHPVTGVGFGDILPSVEQWHAKNNPGGFAYERFRPACEWLVYGAGAGVLGMLCFSIGIFLLLFRNRSNSLVSLILPITSLVPLLTDDTLEGQFGVIVLAFIVFFGQQTFINRQDPS
jgi:O-antigen ligase